MDQPAQIQTLYSYTADQFEEVNLASTQQLVSLGSYTGLGQTRFNHQSVDDLMLCGLQSSELQITSNSRNSSVTKMNQQQTFSPMTYQDLLALGPWELLSRTGKLD